MIETKCFDLNVLTIIVMLLMGLGFLTGWIAGWLSKRCRKQQGETK